MNQNCVLLKCVAAFLAATVFKTQTQRKCIAFGHMEILIVALEIKKLGQTWY
jgi:hypothetical protein